MALRKFQCINADYQCVVAVGANTIETDDFTNYVITHHLLAPIFSEDTMVFSVPFRIANNGVKGVSRSDTAKRAFLP